jgi:hypothetical protein
MKVIMIVPVVAVQLAMFPPVPKSFPVGVAVVRIGFAVELSMLAVITAMIATVIAVTIAVVVISKSRRRQKQSRRGCEKYSFHCGHCRPPAVDPTVSGHEPDRTDIVWIDGGNAAGSALAVQDFVM